MKRNGFTLIELAIVLVIVGLLASGILVAQSMINTAKIGKIIRTISQYDAAVLNFQTKYNSLPGDSQLFGGNGNGQILDAADGFDQFTGEIANFWIHLQQSGFDPTSATYSAVVPIGGFNADGNAPNSPVVSMDTKSGVLPYFNTSLAMIAGNRANFYQFSNWDGMQVSTSEYIRMGNNKPVLKPANALAIDLKIDDGHPAEGRVFDGDIDDMGAANYIGCNDGSKYTPETDIVICFLTVKIARDWIN